MVELLLSHFTLKLRDISNANVEKSDIVHGAMDFSRSPTSYDKVLVIK